MLQKQQKIKALIKSKSLTQQEVADQIGISRNYLLELIDSFDINNEHLAKLPKILGISKVEMLQLLDDSHINKGIPIFNKDFTAGDITQFSDEPQRIIGHIDMNGFRQCVGFVPVKGSSMYPDFVAGDLIGLEPILDFSIIEFGQPFAVVTKNNQRMIKIIRKGKDEDNWILRSTNKDFDDIGIHRDKIQALFKVHGPVRDQWQ